MRNSNLRLHSTIHHYGLHTGCHKLYKASRCTLCRMGYIDKQIQNIHQDLTGRLRLVVVTQNLQLELQRELLTRLKSQTLISTPLANKFWPKVLQLS